MPETATPPPVTTTAPAATKGFSIADAFPKTPIATAKATEMVTPPPAKVETQTPTKEAPKAATVAKTEPVKETPTIAKAEPATVDEADAYQESLSPKSRARFVELSEKQAAKLTDARVKEEVAKLESDPNRSPEWKVKHDALLTELDKREKFIEKVAVQESSAFRNAIVIPREQALSKIEKIAADNGVDATELKTLLTSTQTKEVKARTEELLAEISSMDQDDFKAARREFLEIKDKEKKILDNASTAGKTILEERAAAQKKFIEDQKQSRVNAAKPLVAAFKDLVPELFVEGSNFDLSKKGGEINSILERGLDTLPADAQAGIVSAALMAQPIVETLRGNITTLKAENEELKARLLAFDSAAPEDVGNVTGKTNEGPKPFSLDIFKKK